MLEQLREVSGEILSLEEYLADFRRNDPHVSDSMTKLERLQHFEEPYDESWNAFISGNWDESLRLDEKLSRAKTKELYEGLARRGIEWQRVRVVQLPVTPYVQWELHGLKLRAECGEKIRIISPESVARYEVEQVVPEVIILDATVMYEVLYNENSVLSGGRKIVDQDVVSECRKEVDQLYSDGEEIMSFFEREIAILPPPELSNQRSGRKTSVLKPPKRCNGKAQTSRTLR